jgi:hypothetical protein
MVELLTSLLKLLKFNKWTNVLSAIVMALKYTLSVPIYKSFQ